MALRHECRSCGGSCQGVKVRIEGVESAQFADKLLEHATALGVDRPIVDGYLRRNAGRCAFLRADELCALHGAYGSEAKPRTCRQYPLVVVELVDTGERRVGIDPGCYTHMFTAATGPCIEPSADPLVTRIYRRPEFAAQEEPMLRLLRHADARVEHLVRAVAKVEWADFLPLTQLKLARLQLPVLLEHADTAPKMRAALGPVAQCLARPAGVVPPLSARRSAWALDVTDRMVSLYLAHPLPALQVALLVMCGTILAAATATDDDVAFANALAAWCRLIRAPGFHVALGAS